MNFLLIGIDDKDKFTKLLIEEIKCKVIVYSTDDINKSNEIIKQKNIDFFIIDTKFGFHKIAKMINEIEKYNITKTHGAFVCEEKNDNLIIFAINSGIIDGIIFRPYNKDDIIEMWEKHLNNIRNK